jgi:chemotaxis response regulator CheB
MARERVDDGGKRRDFFVVCLAASCGGVEAYSEILQHIPPDAGLALVIIHHRRGRTWLPEILAKQTRMSVQFITDGMRLQPNQVYVAPSNCQLTCTDGRFRIGPVAPAYGWSRVMTIFIESLARQWKDRAVAVILSGMDADGAEALQSIKAAGGITFAQEPSSAGYTEMPENAIATGYVDFVLPPREIAYELTRLAPTQLQTVT